MNKRSVLLVIQSAFCILTAIVLIAADLSIYYQGLGRKSADPMADIYTADAIAQKAAFVIPVILAAIIVTIICAILKIKGSPDTPAAVTDIRKNTDDNRPASAVSIIRIVTLVIAVIFIIAGILNGSLMDVFIKASKICTECIGLG